jgi:hypothetical protein
MADVASAHTPLASSSAGCRRYDRAEIEYRRRDRRYPSCFLRLPRPSPFRAGLLFVFVAASNLVLAEN